MIILNETLNLKDVWVIVFNYFFELNLLMVSLPR